MSQPWPLVGRDAQLAQVTNTLTDAGARGAVIIGDAGVGKTRLATEAVEGLRAEGTDTIWVSATATAQSISLGAFAPFVDVSASADRADLLRRAVAGFDERSQQSGLVLIVDDAHLLDGTSAALFHLLALHSQVRLLATVRADEAVPDAVTATWKDGLLARVDVHALTRDNTDRLVVAVFGEAVDRATRDRLWNLSRGNALFLRELVLLALEARSGGLPSDRFAVTGSEESGRRLREVMAARFSLLDDSAREALEVLAVGEPLPLELAEHLLGSTALARLERQRFVESRSDSRGSFVRTAHPLYGEIIRTTIPTFRHREVLDALINGVAGTAAPDLLRLMTWSLAAGYDADARALTAAAREALARFDHPLAEQLAAAALAGGDDNARALLSQALVAQGRGQEATSVMEAAVPETAQGVVNKAVATAWSLFWGLDRIDDALATLRRAEQSLGDSPSLLAELRSQLTELLAFAAFHEEAVATAQLVLDEPHAPPVARLRALVPAAGFWAARGQTDRVYSIHAEAMHLADRHRHELPLAELQLRIVKGLAFLSAGRFLEADAYTVNQMGLDSDEPPDPLAALINGAIGLVRFGRGHLASARHHLEIAIDRSAQGDWFGLRPGFFAFLAASHAAGGDTPAARTALDQARAEFGSGSRRTALFDPMIEMAEAWTFAADGRTTSAVAIALDLCRRWRATMTSSALEAVHLAARLGSPEQASAELASWPPFDGPFFAVARAHIRCLEDGDGDSLLAVSRDFEGLGADLLAAECARAAAIGFRRVGLMPAAAAAERRCRTLLERCGDPRPPTLPPDPFGQATNLTSREREVALLAARGAASREIAEQLFLSVRTVDTHLQRVYRKLDVAGRSDLADALGIR